MVFIIGFIGRVEFDVESPEGSSELAGDTEAGEKSGY